MIVSFKIIIDMVLAASLETFSILHFVMYAMIIILGVLEMIKPSQRKILIELGLIILMF